MASSDLTAPVKYRCTLTTELLKKAEDELNEKEKWRERDIQALRDMVLLHKGIWWGFALTECTNYKMIICDKPVQC